MAIKRHSTRGRTPPTVGRDSTERTSSMEALAELSSEVYMLFDENLKLLNANDAGRRMLGVQDDDVEAAAGRSITDIIPDIRKTGIYDDLRKVVENGTPLVLNDVVLTTGSGEKHIKIKAFRIQNCLGVVATDIGDSSQKVEHVPKSAAYYRALVENAVHALVAIKIDGTIQYKSPSAEHMMGYKTEDFMGSSSFDFVHPDDLPDAAGAFAQLVERPGSRISYEIRSRHLNGEWRLLEVTAQNLLDDPDVEGIVCCFQDITERRRTEEECRQNEARFRNVLDNSFDMVYRMDLKTGKYDYVSPSSGQLLGYSPEEFIALGSEHAVSIIHPDDMDRVSESIIKLMDPSSKDRTAWGIEYRIKHRELGHRWVADNISVIHDEANKPVAVVGNLRDVTERRQIVEALRDSEEKLRLMFESATDGMTVTDLDGKIQQVNDAVVRMHGYDDKDELIGRSAFVLIAKKDHEHAAENMRRTLEEGSVSNIEYSFLNYKGEEFDGELSAAVMSDSAGTPIGFIANTRDITERKRMEQALQNSEEHFRALIENSLEAIAILNDKGLLTYLSTSFERLLGYEMDEYLDRSPFEHIHEDDEPKMLNTFTNILQTPGAIMRDELRVWHRNGSLRTVEVVGQNLIENPAVKGIVAHIHDITERRQAEEELQQLYQNERRLRQQLEDEIKRRVEFARALAHELKTPLTSVLASSDLLVSELHDEPLLTLSNSIRQSALNLDSRINELLDLARGEVGMLQLRLEAVDLSQLLRDAVDSMIPLASRRGQSLVLALPASLPPVRADAGRLQQIVANLLTNALKFTPVGGNVKLRAKQKDNSLVVEVQDTGRGISKDDQKWLFEPYYRLEKEHSGGLGLGLALCRTLVELHGGKIWVRSNTGKGSIFGFSLPLEAVGREAPVSEEPSKLWKVLLIEDDHQIVSFISVVLQMRWPEAELISTGLGEEGLDLAETESPDLVVLDLSLPDTDGFEVLRQIRLFSTVPVVILTVKADEVDLVKGFELGADDYVVKPFRQLELLARLKAQVRRKVATDEEGPIVSGSLRLDPSTYQLTYGSRDISLTLVEGRIMRHLLENAGHVVTHYQLAEEVWGEDHSGTVDTLRVYIRHLREKLEEDPGNPRLILTKVGIGYMLAKPPYS